jgi:hypothetical protein
MQLLRATTENELFEHLEIQWKGQCVKYAEDFDYYLYADREHSKKIIADNDPSKGIYVLSNNSLCEAFLLVNHSNQKGFTGKTLRAIEIFLAPVYDYEDVSMSVMALICSAVFTELLRISDLELPSDNIKIHLGPLEKGVFISFVSFFTAPLPISIEIQGLWLTAKKTNS